MHIDPQKCVGCFGCLNFCPETAISALDDKASIIESLCVDCGICAAACALGAPCRELPVKQSALHGSGRNKP